jgi:uncharacterized alkaline shock family protein YloU
MINQQLGINKVIFTFNVTSIKKAIDVFSFMNSERLKRFCFKADFETSYVIEENKDNSVTFNINILYGDASIDTNKKIVSKIKDKINSLL